MAGITKCSGEGCPLKERCYRFTAEESWRKSYFIEVPFRDGECKMYWSVSMLNIFNQLKEITNGRGK